MEKLVSVIITTKNAEIFIGDCLVSIKKQTYNAIEIIVVDNNSVDRTKEIAKQYTKLVFNKGPERSAQRNFGAQKARGEYVLFIDVDMQLSKDVITSCVSIIQKDLSSKAVTIPEESFGEGFWAKCKQLERSFYLSVNWIEAPRFFRKEVFTKIGGYDEENTGTEDYDLPQRIKEMYGEKTIGRINDLIYHNEQKLSLMKTMKKKFYYGKKLTIYQKRQTNKKYYKNQSNLLNRFRLFFSSPRKLLKDPFVGGGMLVMKTAEFGAGGIGYIIGKITNS